MKLAIMQPYFFPYIGYFQLINCVDKWVVFDDTQYIAKGWVNRNRILHPDYEKDWQYFSMPVKKHSHKIRIKDVVVNDNIDWRATLKGKISAYKKRAPYYKETLDFVDDCLSCHTPILSEWAVKSLEKTCAYLGIFFDYSVLSKMRIKTEKVEHAGQWALEIADYMGANEYINPHGGYSIFNEEEFNERNIELHFLRPNLQPYIQRRGRFVAGLSIIDVMMWNDKETIRNMLDDYEIVSQSELRVLHHES